MSRIFLDSVDDNPFFLPKDAVKHLKVLRQAPGDVFTALDGKGCEYKLKLLDGFKAEVIEKIQAPKRCVHCSLYMSQIKVPRFEIVLEKAAELGFDNIIPLVTKNSFYFEISQQRRKRFETILKMGTSQSKNPFSPVLSPLVSFEQAVKNAEGSIFIAHPYGAASDLCKIKPGSKVNLFIGPEGGFTKEEIDTALMAGAHCIMLQGGILRAETAAIVFGGLLKYHIERAAELSC